MRMQQNSFKKYLKEKLKIKTFEAAYGHYSIGLEIGLQVRSLREKAGLTQIELAKRLKVSQQMVSRIESGESDNPSVSTLKGIATATGHQLSIEFKSA